MAKVFKVWPKVVRRANGLCITPDMEVIVTTKMHTTNPFYNGAVEVKERYLQMFGLDLKKGNFMASDFKWEQLG